MPNAPVSLTAINVPDLSPADDDFVSLPTQTQLDWVKLTGQPSNAIERHVRGIRLSRYRAALQAARAARPGRFVISHLPLISAAAANALRLLRRDVPHLAFSFNFTALPSGKRLAYLRHSLRNVDQFTVYSGYETGLYSQLFDLDPVRFVPVIWTQDVPPVQSEPGLPPGSPYFCAIGGEGRDFELLMNTARRVGPAMRFVVIARPQSMAELSVPDNVELLTNIPLARVWRIAMDSLGVLVPLKSRETCCGHVTLVSAKLLGLPLATTYSHATREYVAGREAVLECDPGDSAAFAEILQHMIDEAPMLRAAAQRAQPHELAAHDRHYWAAHVDAFIKAQGLSIN